MRDDDEDGYSVFLSYGKDDRRLAQSLAEHLKASKVAAFYDADNLSPGRTWSPEIGRALASTDTVVAIVSPSSTSSMALTGAEWPSIQDAVWEGKDLKIVPVVIDNAELPPFLRMYQAINAASDEDVDKVAEQVAEAVSRDRPEMKSSAVEEQKLLRNRRLDDLLDSLTDFDDPTS